VNGSTRNYLRNTRGEVLSPLQPRRRAWAEPVALSRIPLRLAVPIVIPGLGAVSAVLVVSTGAPVLISPMVWTIIPVIPVPLAVSVPIPVGVVTIPIMVLIVLDSIRKESAEKTAHKDFRPSVIIPARVSVKTFGPLGEGRDGKYNADGRNHNHGNHADLFLVHLYFPFG
jgi:hypothetical protein